MSWRMARSRVSAFDDRPGAALALASVALAPVAVFASNGTVIILALAGLFLSLSRSRFRAALRALADPLSLTLLAFLLWAALSAMWAPDPMRSLTMALRCLLLFAAGLACIAVAADLLPSGRRLAVSGTVLGGALMLLLLIIETASDAALTRLFRGMDWPTLVEHMHGAPLARGAMLLTLFCWPALLGFARLTGTRYAVLLFLPVPVVLGFQWITASTAAIALAMAAFGLVYLWPRTMLALLFCLFLASVAAAPLLPSLLPAVAVAGSGAEDLPLSWQHRLEIWQFAAATALERPLLGWGFDATRVIGRAARSEVLSGNALALHPHNFSLQVWLELGAIGVLIVIVFGTLLFRRLWRMTDDRAAVATAAAALTGYLVYGQISRGAWQTWWLAAAWLLAATLAAVMPFRPPRPADAIRPE